LLACQVIKRRKTPKLGIVRGNLSDTRLGYWVRTNNTLDKTRGLIPRAGYAPTTAAWRGTAKSNE